MKTPTQICLAFLLVIGVAAIGDVMLRELPNQVLAGLDHPAPRSTACLVLANFAVTNAH